MTAFLVQFGVSNLLASVVLAGIAYAVHRRGRYPVLAHLLWVLVLVKLVTPPIVSLPIARIPVASGLQGPTSAAMGAPLGVAVGQGSLADDIVAALLVTWAIGSATVLVVSLLRIYRFDRLLRRSSYEAPEWIQFMAQDAALRLGLRSVPTIYLTRARLSPLTWWAGGDVRVVLPQGLARDIESDQLAWVLGHELAHVKRRDHLVRWLEWLACVSFWWNPVAWWARQNLRLDEEASCDALVIEQFGARPRSYARALLAVVEHLATPALQPPAVATGIDGGVSLERRFRLIVASRTVQRAPRWLAIGLVGAVVALMPVGVGYATDPGMDDSPAMTGPVTVVSDAERALLSGERRAAAQAAWTSGARNDPPMAKLSATVKQKTRGKDRGASSGKARKATRARCGKAARLSREATGSKHRPRVGSPGRQGKRPDCSAASLRWPRMVGPEPGAAANTPDKLEVIE